MGGVLGIMLNKPEKDNTICPHYMRNLKKAKLIEIESRMQWLPGSQQWEKWEILVKVHKLPAVRLINSKNLMHKYGDYLQQYCIIYLEVKKA